MSHYPRALAGAAVWSVAVGASVLFPWLAAVIFAASAIIATSATVAVVVREEADRHG